VRASRIVTRRALGSAVLDDALKIKLRTVRW